MGKFTEEELRQVIATYEATKNAALAQRDASLRAFHAAGWRPTEIQRVTGYSRETIRQALNPQARDDINSGRRATRALRSQEGGPTYVVPSTLAELQGPTTGTVRLPSHLISYGEPDDHVYDLTNRVRLTRMYGNVMHTAASVDDLRAWLDKDLLVKVWPELLLAPPLRARWERRFPALGRRWSYRE